jgi:predicted dinucleotide-binding enzyme
MAALYSLIIGKPVKHVQISFDVFRDSLHKMGASSKVVDNTADLYQFLIKGGFDNVSEDVASLTYHRPRSFAHFIREHSYAFSDKLKVGILGSGEVGQTLGSGLLKWGYKVMLGSRDPTKAEVVSWLQANFGPHASLGNFGDAAKFADIVIIATRDGGDTEGSLITAGLEHVKGKIVWDTINPLSFADDGSAHLKIGLSASHGESVQKWVPNAKVVKVFNAIGAGDMVNPMFEDGDPTMFIAGDDQGAKSTTTAVLSDLGWKHIVDTGAIAQSRLLEPMAVLWFRYSVQKNSTHHSFSLLTK